MKRENLKKSYAALALTLISVLGSGCAKIREASFPEGAGENVFEVSLFSKSDMSLQTEGAGLLSSVQSKGRKLKVGQQAARLAVARVSAPESLRSMFKSLEIPAAAAKNYPVRFKVDRQFVTAFRVVSELSELSIQEQQLTQKSPSGEILLPLFQYRVQGYGQVVRAKNDLGQETSTLRLKPTEWSQATHVQVSTLPEDRISVEPSSRDSAERIFVRGALDGEVFSRSELADELDIRVARGEQFRTLIDGSEMVLQEILSLDDPAVTSAQREQLAAGERGAKSTAGSIARCESDLVKKLAKPVENCVRVSRYRVPVSFVEAKRRQVDSEGTLGSEVEFRPALQASAKLVQISRDPLVAEIGASSLDARRALKVSEVKDWEFLFRRTLEDSPNSFDYSFAGSSGPLEIVRLVFEKDKVRLVRADALLPHHSNNRVDLADLLSVPAQYFREEKTDASGNLLAVPRVVPTDSTDPRAVAYVSWESNSVPPISSALNYYELGQCFAGATDSTVSAVDHRLDSDGVLSFSVSTTYANNPGMDCAGVLSAGYFDRVQPTFTFQERFSLRKHALASAGGAKREKPLLDVPYEAQKKLGFGIFTYSKKTPNAYGNIGADGTVTPLPALFDVTGGRKVRYVLAGLPSATGSKEDVELRSRLIQATREVVAEWNEAFRKAFLGTPMERKDDVLELVVEGEGNVPQSALGDLDVNHIYYISKATSSGVIGLGGAHSNPRSGKVEAASVFIYGGNIYSYIDSMKQLKQAREQYVRQMGSPLVSLETPIHAPTSGKPAESVKFGSSFVKSGSGARLSAQAGRLAGRSGLSMKERRELIARGAHRGAELGLHDAMATAVQEGSVRDSHRMQALVDAQVLEAVRARGGAGRRSALSLQARRSETVSRLMSNLSSANTCVHEAPEPTLDAALAEKSDIDLMIGVYKPTLAHELGHNLGLRHNFIGSFDKANWKFDAADSSKRDYSSVMDYLASDEHYDGLGPYDVAAIRAAYAGMLQTGNGKLVPMGAVLQALGLKSWNQLASGHLNGLGLKRFEFCSDEDAGYTPVCNRFDRGTTPEEIVRASIADYRQLYTLRNFAGDRPAFSVLGTGAYAGRLFSKFVGIRQFLEETIHQAINGAEGEVIDSYVKAAIAGLDFFHSVVRSADAPEVADEDERIVAATLQDGRTVKIERKWLKDMAFDRDSDRLRIRGVELDKIISLMMLTERQLGFARYESESLRFSYPEFERLVFRDAKSPLELPTVALIQEVLSNQLRPAGVVVDASGAEAGMIPLDARFKSSVTEQMRLYAMLGGVVFQDVDGLEARDNGSSLYRVMAAFSVRADSSWVTKPGSSRADQDQLKFWAPADAVVAKSLVDRMLMLEKIEGMRTELLERQGKIMAKLQEISETADQVQKGSPSVLLETPEMKLERLKKELAAEVKAFDDSLASLPEESGAKTFAELMGLIEHVVEAAMALQQSQPEMDAHKFALAVDQRRTQVSTLMKANPIAAELLQVVASQKDGPALLPILLSGSSNASERGTVFSNIEGMNRFMLAIHPELKR